jgi:receptor-type tyrosine-protein phosphatase gamma
MSCSLCIKPAKYNCLVWCARLFDLPVSLLRKYRWGRNEYRILLEKQIGEWTTGKWETDRDGRYTDRHDFLMLTSFCSNCAENLQISVLYLWLRKTEAQWWCVFSCRVGEDGEWDVSNGILTQSNETNYQVTGLFPFTVYSFRVLAVNAMGRSRPSKESYYMVTLREGEYLITAAS